MRVCIPRHLQSRSLNVIQNTSGDSNSLVELKCRVMFTEKTLNMEPSPGRVCRVTPSASHTLPLIPIKHSWAGEYGSWGRHLPLRSRERQLGMICLSLWFLLLRLIFSFMVLPLLLTKGVRSEKGGGLGTACAPHSLAMWLSCTPGNALSLLAHGRVWHQGLLPVPRREWTVSPEDCW